MKPFLILAITACLAFGVKAADLAGTWKGSMETQMGKTDVTINITTGPALAGRVDFGSFEGAIEKAALDGDKISFEVTIQHGKIAFAGTVAGDEIRFAVTGTQGDQYSLISKRQNKAE